MSYFLDEIKKISSKIISIETSIQGLGGPREDDGLVPINVEVLKAVDGKLMDINISIQMSVLFLQFAKLKDESPYKQVPISFGYPGGELLLQYLKILTKLRWLKTISGAEKEAKTFKVQASLLLDIHNDVESFKKLFDKSLINIIAAVAYCDGYKDGIQVGEKEE